MPDVQISRSDVEQLARKLDSLRSDFTDHEWTLLSAVFAVATEAIGPIQSGAADPGVVQAAGRPPASAPGGPLGSFTAGEDDEPSPVPGKIGRASLHDQVLESFTPGQDDDSSSGSGPDKIGRA
jgi:hypothetical protein